MKNRNEFVRFVICYFLLFGIRKCTMILLEGLRCLGELFLTVSWFSLSVSASLLTLHLTHSDALS